MAVKQLLRGQPSIWELGGEGGDRLLLLLLLLLTVASATFERYDGGVRARAVTAARIE
jgi:hypothetical protein